MVWDITDKLALTAGVRYSSDEKVVDFDNTRVQNPVVVEGDNTDYKLGIDYQFTPDILAYASWSTGYRPGSYNPRPFQATQVVAVDAEDSEAYELGVKSDWFDRRLRTNLAVFYTDWKTRITPVGGTECFSLGTWGRRLCTYRMIRILRDPDRQPRQRLRGATTVPYLLREHARRGRGRRGRGQLGAGRRSGVQRPVWLDRLGIARHHR